MAAKRLYEGMFLVDSAQATADWDGTLGVIENILKRADADVVAIRKWGERKLAYDVDHKSRGTYILSYFNAEGPRIAGIEKDVQLSEKVMRVLVLTTEKRPQEIIEQDISGITKEETSEQAQGQESDERGGRREREERPAQGERRESEERREQPQPEKPAEKPAEPAEPQQSTRTEE